ncbi:MAG: hypothetical protein ACE5EG_06390, partial [Thermoanaerobaculia bacterium]
MFGLVAVSLLAGALLLIFTCRPQAAEPAYDSVPLLLGEAEKASFSHDVARERAVLERAERLTGSPEDLAEVQRRLAVIEWKYHARFDEARARLLRATGAAEPAEAWLALARLEQARERFDAARKAALKARELADSPAVGRQALIALARASVGEATARRLRGEQEQGISEALPAVFEELRGTVARDPGHLEPSRLLLRAALLLDDGPTALLGWRSYFHVTSDRVGPNLVAEAGRELRRLLRGWPGPDAAAEARVDLTTALAASRLFTEGALVGLAGASPGAAREDLRVRRVVAYARFLRQARRLTEEYYRQTILGNDKRRSWQASLSEAASPLLSMLEDEALERARVGPVPPVDPGRVGRLGADLVDLLNRRFGAYISIGKTAGYFDLHMGHRVLDETRIVEQYGHRAELRFVALDNLVSNGFQSWAWESGAQHGGWNKPYGIYQVRPAYVGRSLEAWQLLHSAEELRERLDEMQNESALDDERAARDPHAYLPGLAKRLRHQGERRLLERLRSGGLEGEPLRLAFVAAYDHAVQESSIFAHEGRHAIDRRAGGMFQALKNPEFTAKLAEVAFAPEPRLALGGIL